MSNMVKCSCWAVNIINQKMEITPKVFGTRPSTYCYKRNLPKEFLNMKRDSTKSPSDDFLQIFTKTKYDDKLTEPNVQL